MIGWNDENGNDESRESGCALEEIVERRATVVQKGTAHRLQLLYEDLGILDEDVTFLQTFAELGDDGRRETRHQAVGTNEANLVQDMGAMEILPRGLPLVCRERFEY